MSSVYQHLFQMVSEIELETNKFLDNKEEACEFVANTLRVLNIPDEEALHIVNLLRPVYKYCIGKDLLHID